jgi:stage II sporulation protein M
MYNGKELRAVLLAIAIFLIAAVIGGIAVTNSPAVGEELMELINEEIFTQLMSENPAIVTLNIFINNLQASTILFLGGVSFGLITLLILTLNGFIIGVVAEMIRQEQGLLFFLAGVLPHGIFEIPAFILAGSYGILLGMEVWRELKGDGDAVAAAGTYGRKFLLLVLPLLAIAACIEGFITPEILNLLT